MSDSPAEHEHMRLWLRARMTGCAFAALFAGKQNKMTFASVDHRQSGALTAIEQAIDESAMNDDVAMLMFPDVRTEPELVGLLANLSTHPRWTVCQHPGENERIRIRALWTTTHQQQSAAMGFAPLMTMPITRRAPYTTIAVWAGPRRKRPGSATVGFIDMPPLEPKERHRTHFEKTESMTRSILGPEAAPELWRTTAFALSVGLAHFNGCNELGD